MLSTHCESLHFWMKAELFACMTHSRICQRWTPMKNEFKISLCLTISQILSVFFIKNINELSSVEQSIGSKMSSKLPSYFLLLFLIYPQFKTRPSALEKRCKLYPLERQLTKISEPSFDLEGGDQGQI